MKEGKGGRGGMGCTTVKQKEVESARNAVDKVKNHKARYLLHRVGNNTMPCCRGHMVTPHPRGAKGGLCAHHCHLFSFFEKARGSYFKDRTA